MASAIDPSGIRLDPSVIERVRLGQVPRPTPDNDERVSAWSKKLAGVRTAAYNGVFRFTHRRRLCWQTKQEKQQ